MKSKNILTFFSAIFILTPILFVSGCVEGGGLDLGFLGIGEQTTTAPKDVLVIQNLQVIPDPVTANSPFTVIFQVVNVGDVTEGSKEARDVEAYAYDWGRCKPEGTETDGKVYAFKDEEIYPGGGAEVVELEFKAPTNEELGRMDGICPIRFKVSYTYDAYTTSDISVVSRDRMIEASRAGETITVTPHQTQSRGPIKIDVNFDVQQPIIEDLIAPVLIKVRDVGSGMYEKVPAEGLKVEFQKGLENKINCYGFGMKSDSDDGLIWVNGKDIPLIKGESPIIRCDIRTEGLNIEDIKTYTVRAEITYQYPLYGEKIVNIKSTYEQKESETGGGEETGGTGGDTEGDETEDSGSSNTGNGEEGTNNGGETDEETPSSECKGVYYAPSRNQPPYAAGLCSEGCSDSNHITYLGFCFWGYEGHTINLLQQIINVNRQEKICLWENVERCDEGESCTDTGCS